MAGSAESTRGWEDWDAPQMAEYLKTKDLGQYEETFISNGITGQVAPNLTESQLKEMGISVVGDRIRITEALKSLRESKVQAEREKVLWEGEEVLYYSCFHRLCATCCGCCPGDPDTYILRSNHLEIKNSDPCRVGPITCCCGRGYEIDNVDISNITDVDVQGVPPSCLNQTCCCGSPVEHVQVKTSNEGDKELKLAREEGQKVARMIKNQVEIMQRMERK